MEIDRDSIVGFVTPNRSGYHSKLPHDVLECICVRRAGGDTLEAIADALNGDQIPTAQGGRRWRPNSVRAVLLSRRAGEILARLEAGR